MIYKNPNTVVSPRPFVKLIKVLFDGGPHSISIAEILWKGDPVYAYRWNIAQLEWEDDDKKNNLKECFGYPVSRSQPTWMVLPAMFDLSLINLMIEKEMQRLKEKGYIE